MSGRAADPWLSGMLKKCWQCPEALCDMGRR